MRPLRRIGRTFAAFALAVTAAVCVTHATARAADQSDSPITRTRSGADITDTYMFPSPNTPGNVVVVMDVRLNPSNPYFDQSVLYQMKFDNRIAAEAQGAAPTENMVIQFSMGVTGGSQQIFVYGPGAPNQTGSNSSLLAQTGTGYINKAFATTNGMNVFAGVREDPFFFDYGQFYNMFPDRNDTTQQSCLPASFGGDDTCPLGFSASGTDQLHGPNVLAIVVELPKTILMPNGLGRIAYWATTSTATGQ